MKTTAAVKIHVSRNAKQTLHQVCWWESGKRERKTFSHAPDAKRFARLKASELARGAQLARGLTFADSQSYSAALKALGELSQIVPLHEAVLSFTEAAKLVWAANVTNAVRFYAEHHREITPVRLDEAVPRFIQSRETMEVSRGHIAQIGRHLSCLLTQFPGRNLEELRVAELQSWVEGLPWQASTKNFLRRTLVAFGHWAQKQGHLAKQRPSEFKGLSRRKEPPREIKTFTPEQMRKLLDHAAPPLLLWLVVGGFCGLRGAELHRLEWTDIRWDQRCLILPGRKTKTARRRSVEIPANALQFLLPYRNQTGRILPYSDRQTPQKMTAALCVKLGFAWQLNGLRHSFCTYHYALKGNKHETARLAGNSPAMLDQHYLDATSRAQAQAWFSIQPTWTPLPIAMDSPDLPTRLVGLSVPETVTS